VIRDGTVSEGSLSVIKRTKSHVNEAHAGEMLTNRRNAAVRPSVIPVSEQDLPVHIYADPNK